MSELEAPPPPGSDTPVPLDVVAAPRRRRATASAPDGLVPKTAIEQRVERRERDRRTRALPPPLANPMAGAVPPYAAQLAWEAQQRANGQPQPTLAYPQQPYPSQPYPSQAYGPSAAWPPPPGMQPYPPYAMPYPPQPYAMQPYAMPQPMPYPPVIPLPPKPRLTRRQTRAALLGSLVGQTLLALATHLLVTAGFVLLLWGAFSEGGTDGLDALDADSLTDVVAFWADPARIPLTIVIVLIATGAIGAAGCIASFLWQRAVGLVGVKRSIALAYATTTAIGGFVGLVLWPIVLIFGLFGILLSSAAVTIGTMWGLLFASLAVSIVLTGLLGMLFGWVYLLAFRPRPTWADLEARQRQAEIDAERQAMEADAAELARVE